MWWLRCTGEARVMSAGELDDAMLGDIVVALRQKYVQYAETPVLNESRQLLHLIVNDTRAWAFGGDDWLEQQFRG